ncbi:MAG: SpoIIE family protein phosphatase, partial [Candidatus Eremiobacteraeota bacterium]|nr:SpoIIE family protein phosphatase [Candidatus Eremiobacteraeota bacterium]
MTLGAQEGQTPYPEREYLSFLLRATELLGQSLDYAQTLQNVAQASVATIADICIMYLGEAGKTQTAAVAHRDSSRAPDLKVAGRYLESEPGRGLHPVYQVLKTRQTYYAPDIDHQWIVAHATSAQHAEFMQRMEYTSMIVVPLISRIYGLSGALMLATTLGGHPRFSKTAVDFAEGLARVCSTNIGKARLYDEAHNTAMSFQQAALPKTLPAAPGICFHSYYRPASETLLVGGDWYDAFFIPDGRIAISVGDVSGHRLEAAVSMASIRDALRTAMIMEPDIGRALDTVDFLIRAEHGDELFCTAVLAILDAESLPMRLSSAGHPAP